MADEGCWAFTGYGPQRVGTGVLDQGFPWRIKSSCSKNKRARSRIDDECKNKCKWEETDRLTSCGRVEQKVWEERGKY